jgi:polysaccharide export outer membrane protein
MAITLTIQASRVTPDRWTVIMANPNKYLSATLLALALMIPSGKMAAQQSSDISPSNSTVPGMEKTTASKGVRIGAGLAASYITPAATGRSYPLSGELLIGIGDLLHISVYDTPEFDQDPRVDPAGNIDFAGVGTVKVMDRQPAEVAGEIQQRLKDGGIVLHPVVGVAITDYVSHGVAIGGEVRSPGIYPILGKRRLSDLLTVGGGPTELSDGTADIRHASNGETDHVALATSAETYTVIPGDSITLTRAALVYIVGNVRRSGGFPLAHPTTLSQGIALAQGFSPSAKDKNAYLFRDAHDGTRVAMRINLHDILRGKAADIQMKANDVLFVPNSGVADVAKALANLVPSVATAEVYTHP